MTTPEADARIGELEATLRDVLNHLRPQGHPAWKVHTALVTDEQLTAWKTILNATAVQPEIQERIDATNRALAVLKDQVAT